MSSDEALIRKIQDLMDSLRAELAKDERRVRVDTVMVVLGSFLRWLKETRT